MADRSVVALYTYQQGPILRLKAKDLFMTLVEIIRTINEQLRAQLEKYHCERGQLRYQAPSMVSLTGIKADEKPIMIWQTDTRLGYLLSQYVDQAPDGGGVSITIDLSSDQFTYFDFTTASIKQEAQLQEEHLKQDDDRQKLDLRKTLSHQTEKFGKALAEKVASSLLTYSLGYGHRDYCGMGLEYKDGVYYYGELWDGYMMEPLLKWPSMDDFVNWLAQQSDASLARLEAKESFYWGNQTITRQRLKTLVAEL